MKRVLFCLFSLLLIVQVFSIALFNIVTTLIAVVCLFELVREPRKLQLLKDPLLLAFAAFLGVVVLSISQSAYPSASWRGLTKYLKGFILVFAVLLASFNKSELRKIIGLLLIILGVVGLDALFQSYFGWEPVRLRHWIPFHEGHGRLTATFHHSNDFGTYLVMVLPLAVLGAYTDQVSRSRSARVGVGIVLALALLSLVRTYSVGAWISFAIAMVLLIFLRKNRYFLSCVLVGAVLFFLCSPRLISEKLHALTQFHSGSVNSIQERLYLWSGTLHMIRERPILGFGVNTYARVFPSYKPKDYPDVRYAHNGYLQLTSEMGLLGFLAFIVILMIYVRRTFFLFRSNDEWLRVSYSAFLSGLTAFLIHALFDTNLHSVLLVNFFWILLALSYSMRYLEKNDAGFVRAT